MGITKTNPNGSNQWLADPRQALFLAYFLDPESDTFSNAMQSALKAGFDIGYAENILNIMPKWLAEKLGNSRYSKMLEKAEKNIEEILSLPSETHVMGAFGPIYEKIKKKVKGKKGKKKTVTIKKPLMALNKGLLKLKADTSHFVAERVGKKIFATKEADNPNIFNINIFANEQRTKIANRIIGGGSASDSPSQGASD